MYAAMAMAALYCNNWKNKRELMMLSFKCHVLDERTHTRRGTVTAAASLPPEMPPVSSLALMLSIDTPV